MHKLADRIHTIRKVDKDGMNIENTDADFFFKDDQDLVVVYLEKPIENATKPARICREIEFLRNQHDIALSPDGVYDKMKEQARIERSLHPDWKNHMTAEDHPKYFEGLCFRTLALNFQLVCCPIILIKNV